MPRALGQPPQCAFADRPVGFATGEQQRGGAAKRGLMADDEDGGPGVFVAIRPVNGGEQGGAGGRRGGQVVVDGRRGLPFWIPYSVLSPGDDHHFP